MCEWFLNRACDALLRERIQQCLGPLPDLVERLVQQAGAEQPFQGAK